jgi:hypothetical protein
MCLFRTLLLVRVWACDVRCAVSRCYTVLLWVSSSWSALKASRPLFGFFWLIEGEGGGSLDLDLG